MESNAAERWIRETLAADAALTAVVGTRIYNSVRPDGSAFPCVVFQMQAPGRDLMVLGGIRVWADMIYMVKGIAEQDSYAGDLATIANRIDTVLHAQSGVNVSGTIWTCVRERPWQMPEVADGRQYRHLGGLYRIQAR